MFTGIIQEVGTIQSVIQTPFGRTITIDAHRFLPVLGASVSVNGACLTVISTGSHCFSMDIVQETLNKTTLGTLTIADRVNLEPSARLGDEMSGHLVTGHVDTVVTVERFENGRLTIRIPESYLRFIAEKGSITLSGVSLTVASKQEDLIEVALVPFTLEHTILGKVRKSSKLNLEIDLIARYVSNLI